MSRFNPDSCQLGYKGHPSLGLSHPYIYLCYLCKTPSLYINDPSLYLSHSTLPKPRISISKPLISLPKPPISPTEPPISG